MLPVAEPAWPLLQGTAAATAAWVIATKVFDHKAPFFAPIAAIVALNAPLGRRGGNALRLLLGVVVGILVGELTLGALGSDWAALAFATFVAMAIATALDGARIVIAQAAGSAILTVAVADGGFGAQRLLDALIGAAVALAFSQLLFSPDPVALLRRAEGAALAEIADALGLTARALERDDRELVEQAMSRLRRLTGQEAALGETRAASHQVASRAPVWRSRLRTVDRESAHARNLDLLGASCLVLARTVLDTGARERHGLSTALRDLSGVLGDLARAPGDRLVRRRAVDRARPLARRDAPSEHALCAVTATVRLVAADTIAFAADDPADVRRPTSAHSAIARSHDA